MGDEAGIAGEALDGAASKHTIPAIERMMDLLGLLESHASGLSIRQLTERLKVPRTTVYRILNTLEPHGMVRRGDGSTYRLGRRLLSLAAQVGSGPVDLTALAQPQLDRLSRELREGVKLSVVDGTDVLVLAAARSANEFALVVAPGQHLPIHAGAASKLLLAYLPEAQRAEHLGEPLQAFTSRTITDPRRLASELDRIRRQGWAQDKGENAPSIQAFAAPVVDSAGDVIAALSVPFLAGAEIARMEEIRLAVIAAARTLSDSLPN